MMDQFKVAYIPGGMSLNHSAWWLVLVTDCGDVPMRWLRQSTYN